jgi:hypothetical protein
MTQKRKITKIAVKDLEIIYVPFGPAAEMCFHIEALVLSIVILLEAGAAICGDITEKPRMVGDDGC